MTPNHYAWILSRQLEQRRQLNPRYSLRSFARQLRVSPSYLSKLFRGQKRLSLRVAEKISGALFFDPASAILFRELVRLNTSGEDRSPGAAKRAEQICRQLEETGKRLSDEQFRYFSSWTVFSIFELLALREAPNGAEEMAGLLGVGVDEAEQALRHLQLAGLIEPGAGGRFLRKQRCISTSNNIPSAGIRLLHKQFLGKAIQAVDKLGLDRRYFRAKTVSLKAELLPELKAAVENFLGEIARIESQSEGLADSLYQLNVQLFDLLEKPDEAKGKTSAA